MRNEKKYTEIILETLSKLYEVSEPKLDFMDFINTTTKYLNNDTYEKITLDEHLSLEEMHNRNLVIDVPFEEHFIDKDLFENIMKEQIKKYKLNKMEQQRFKNQIYLGCSPTFKNDRYFDQINQNENKEKE